MDSGTDMCRLQDCDNQMSSADMMKVYWIVTKFIKNTAYYFNKGHNKLACEMLTAHTVHYNSYRSALCTSLIWMFTTSKRMYMPLHWLLCSTKQTMFQSKKVNYTEEKKISIKNLVLLDFVEHNLLHIQKHNIPTEIWHSHG